MSDNRFPTREIRACIRRCDRVLADGRSIRMSEDAEEELDALRKAARVLARPMDYTTDQYVKASALLKALAEEAT